MPPLHLQQQRSKNYGQRFVHLLQEVSGVLAVFRQREGIHVFSGVCSYSLVEFRSVKVLAALVSAGASWSGVADHSTLGTYLRRRHTCSFVKLRHDNRAS